MSQIADAADPAARRPSTIEGPATAGFRWRRRLAIGAAVMVLGWSVVELGNLAVVHTIGPELYGVLVAVIAVGAGVVSLVLLRTSERRLWATVALLILWGVVALGGLAGTVAHVVGPVAGHGPVDPRPRPIAAPLIFTVLAVVGSTALWFGQRRATPHARSLEKE